MDTRSSDAPARSDATTGDAARVWGLAPHELHDAYWRGRGVVCVRRGDEFDPVPGAELYMLMEPGQCVVFDLRTIAEAIGWNRAPLSRIRVREAVTEHAYAERIVEDDTGRLVRFERSYRAQESGGFRLILTRKPSVAQIWADARTRRAGWTEIRRVVPWTRTDFHRVDGSVHALDTAGEGDRLLERLVTVWKDPSRVIEGVVALRRNVWGLAGTDVRSDDVLVGPLWVGRLRRTTRATNDRDRGVAERAGSHDVVAIGPRVVPDAPDVAETMPAGVRVRAIVEIFPPKSRRAESESRPALSTYAVVKRLLDIGISATVLVVFAPLLLAVAIAVVIDDGFPIFFGHVRQTRGGRNFKCWKFRTMLRDAERMVPQLQAKNKADGPQVFIENDPRVTRIGHTLRKFHLDELPQFWNVLLGDMSLVGPRPSPDRENQFCPAWRELRLSVRPGITGLWQVERTREPGKDFQEWIRYDIEYVNRANLWLDARICVQTVLNIIRRDG